MKVQIIAHTPNPEKLIAAAAKLCYSQKVDIDSLMESLTPDNVEKFVAKLERLGHQSPFEHVNFTFAIEGVSRAFLAQASRHRVGTSLSVRSQRYCSESGFDTIIPPTILANEEAKSIYDYTIDVITKSYKRLQDMGIPNEDARAILPNSCETRMIMTMNVRQLWHYFAERCCVRAQEEHRLVATEMLRLCRGISPLLFKHAGAKCVKGYCPENDMSCGRKPTLSQLLESYDREKK